MPDSGLILHHYDASTYSEKIRLIMGYKGLSWRSTQQPDVMPKPGLQALTGGYRLVPVLQVGSNIYCDSDCIARRLERETSAASLFAGAAPAIERGLCQWGESIVFALVTISLARGVFSPPSTVFSENFIADRQAMSGPGFNPETAKRFVDWRLTQLRSHLSTLEHQLADSRPFVMGDQCSSADFAIYHPLWSLDLQGSSAELQPHKRTLQWFERISGFGHGHRKEISLETALAEAADSVPSPPSENRLANMSGFSIGDRVRARHEAYDGGAVTGELVWADADDVALLRADDSAGELLVHIPRQGFTLSRIR